MISTYNPYLVAISGAIAMLAAYVMLEVSSQLALTEGSSRNFWLAIGAFSMGIGIWAMHFIAMLAFSIPTYINYNFVIVVISLIAAMLGSGQGLFIVSRPKISTSMLVLGSTCMGIAIAGMHYIGMLAMQMQADVSYNPLLFLLSVAIAIVVSGVALKIAFGLQHRSRVGALWRRITSAIVMGFAVLSMHYTGMSAAVFTPNYGKSTGEFAGVDNYFLGFLVGGVAFIILALSLYIIYLDNDSRSLER